MTRVFLLGMAVLGLQGPLPSTCEPQACLADIAQRTPVAQVPLSEADAVGQWTDGPGLTGSELYLFPDHTFIVTHWGCLEPETIHDKGRWSVAGGLVLLTPDSDVTWTERRDRRFLALRNAADQPVRLMGLDWSFEAFVSLVDAEPESGAGYFTTVSLVRLAKWTPSKARRVKAGLMKRAWRPEYFAETPTK